MKRLKQIGAALRSMWPGLRADCEIDEELRFHVERRSEELQREGCSPSEARRRALVELGGPQQIKEELRAMRTGIWLETLGQDLRYAARQLRKSPGFTAVAVLTLALGIGANTAIFSVVQAVLLRPLPYPAPDRLTLLWTNSTRGAFARSDTTGPDFLDWREYNRSFTGLAAYSPNPMTITGAGDPERVPAFLVTQNLFEVMGAGALRGRVFLPEEAKLGNHRVALISAGAWQRRFGSDPQVVGKTVTLNGNDYSVVGVMPAAFRFPSAQAEFWLPLPMDHPVLQERGEHFLTVVGRLRPEASVAQAQSDMNRVADLLRQQYPQNRFRGVLVAPLLDELVGDVRPTLWMLFGAVGMVTLIACVNLANLMLNRSVLRQGEMAVRAALGAGRLRLVRQVLTEGILLSLLGGAAGLVVGHWAVAGLLAWVGASLPRQEEVGMDTQVLLFALGLSVLVGVLFAAVPALDPLRRGVQASWGAAADTRSRARVRNVLVAGEIALSLTLLVGCGLMLTSVDRLLRVDPGFQPQDVVSLELNLPEARYRDNPQQIEFADRLLEQLAKLPGAQSVALVSHLPLKGDFWRYGITMPGRRPLPEGARKPVASYRLVSESYFQTMRIPLIRGRGFTELDHAGAPRVLVINQTMARLFFPNQEPLGQRIKFSFCQPDPCEVVGIAGDVKHFGLDAAEDPAMYGAYRQKPEAFMNQAFFVVRAEPGVPAPVAAAKRVVWSLDPALAVASVTTLEEMLTASVGSRRLVALLLTIFAGVAVALTLVGVYGVMSYTTVQRGREFGVRLALGAEPADLLRLVLRQGLAVTLTGLVMGVALALCSTWLLAAYLFEITPTDPAVFVSVAVLLALVALLACWLPGRRAMRVDPAVTLRYQ